jgi:hypothetical protein
MRTADPLVSDPISFEVEIPSVKPKRYKSSDSGRTDMGRR